MPDVLLIYSLIILSLEQALLFFKDLIHYKISVSVIVEFTISSLSFSEKFKSSIVCSLLESGYSLGSLKSYKGCQAQYCFYYSVSFRYHLIFSSNLLDFSILSFSVSFE